LLRSHAGPRRACELHTHRVWQSLADPDGDSNSYGDSYRHGYGNPYGDSNCGTASNSDTAAAANTGASPLGQ
jgi:hypothetical protein